MVRQGIVGLLNRENWLEVVAEAGDGRAASRQAEQLQPDLILMDVNMPESDGVEATRQIKGRQPGIIIVGLALDEDHRVVQRMARTGADAYVSKRAAADELIDRIRRAAANRASPLSRAG